MGLGLLRWREFRVYDNLMRAAILALAILALAPAAASRAEAPESANDPAISEWYRSLRSPDTDIGCCSEADCRPTEYRITPTGDYEAFVDDEWLIVPKSKILDHKDNPVGRAVICYSPYLGILCFVRAPEI